MNNVLEIKKPFASSIQIEEEFNNSTNFSSKADNGLTSLFSDNLPNETLEYFFNNEVIGTNFLTLKARDIFNFETKDPIGFFNDDYDIIAKMPVKKTFSVFVKVKSISKFQPSTFVDFE